MFEKAIVAYIDILGYKDLVERVTKKSGLVKGMEELFYRASVDAVRKLSELNLGDVANETDPEIQDYFKQVVDTIRVRCIADSFIFTLPVSKINFSCKAYDEKTTVENCIETYFSTITMFATLFVSKMGYLLRGGISIGNHYESERENQLFVFSEAHNRAVTLEKKKAKYPRIVLDEPLQQYLEDISYSHIQKFFYREEDGNYCLDIYSALHNWGENKKKILADIREGITLNLESNFNNARELGKLIYFARYHNRKVTSTEANLTHLVFDISKYEERIKLLTHMGLTPGLKRNMKLIIYAGLTEDMNNGWVWLPESVIRERTTVRIKNLNTGRSIYCEALPIGDNFVERYNQGRRINIKDSAKCIVINEWYRMKLGISSTQTEHDFEIKRAENPWGHMKASLQHPQIVVRLSTELALIGFVLGMIGLVLGLISMNKS